MKKFFFYISILILCILVWLNIGNNKEGITKKRRRENQKRLQKQLRKNNINNKNGIQPPRNPIFLGMSAENLYDIYKAIDELTEKKSVVSGLVSGVGSKIADTAANLKTTTNAITSSFEFEDSKDDEPPESRVITKKTCPTKEEVIKQLIDLRINDDEFNALINQKDVNKAYSDLIKNLKMVPTVPYNCIFKKKGHKTHSRINPMLCNPTCKCLKDSNMCKNYKYLQTVYNDQIDPVSIMKISKSSVYSYGADRSLTTAIDLDDLKIKLKDYFKFMPEIS